MAGSAIDQHYDRVENVYNINRDLILSTGSTAADLARQLASLHQEVVQLPGRVPQTRVTSLKVGDAAIEESLQPKPKVIEIQKHLDTAASVIEKTQDIEEARGDIIPHRQMGDRRLRIRTVTRRCAAHPGTTIMLKRN